MDLSVTKLTPGASLGPCGLCDRTGPLKYYVLYIIILEALILLTCSPNSIKHKAQNAAEGESIHLPSCSRPGVRVVAYRQSPDAAAASSPLPSSL